MQINHNQICTWNSEVETGKIYLYTEGNLECKVKVLQTNPEQEGIRLGLKVVSKPKTSPMALGEEFDVMARPGNFSSGSWWNLHDNDLIKF